MLTHLELSQFLLLLGAQRADVQFGQMSVSGHSSFSTFSLIFPRPRFVNCESWYCRHTVTCCCQLRSLPAADSFLVNAYSCCYGKLSRNGPWLLHIFIATFCVESQTSCFQITVPGVINQSLRRQVAFPCHIHHSGYQITFLCIYIYFF